MKDICYSRLHLFLFVGFLVDGPKKNKNTAKYTQGSTKLAHTRSSTTVYYKAYTNTFPVLLCTTKLAQSPSQYYFVLQSLHKALPNSTLYYKA